MYSGQSSTFYTVSSLIENITEHYGLGSSLSSVNIKMFLMIRKMLIMKTRCSDDGLLVGNTTSLLVGISSRKISVDINITL